MRQQHHGLLRHGLLIFILAGTGLRLLLPFFDSPMDHLFSDPQRHWDNAGRFLHPLLMNGCDPLGYQVFLFLTRKLSFDNRFVLNLFTGILSAAMPWLYYRAARSLGLEQKPAAMFWSFMLWMPSFLVIYSFFMVETLLLPLMGLGLWMTGRALRRKDLPSFLLMTVCWTLAALTKAQALLPLILCCGYALWQMPRRIPALIAALALTALMLIPNTLRTRSILGFPSPFGNSCLARIMHAGGTKHTQFYWENGRRETLIYSSPSCYIHPLEPLNEWRIGRGDGENTMEVVIHRKNGRNDWTAALAGVRRSASVWLQHLGENVVLFLFAPSWPETSHEGFPGAISRWQRWLWAPLIFQVLIGNAAFLIRRPIPLLPLLTSAMLLVLCFQNSVTMEGRYRKPLEPLLLLNFIWLCSKSGAAGGGTPKESGL
ncbi:MAG: glycosyltransferase family 39 protein [Verrucomicrobiae bacterium]|nr:glycosyltransferase family 39 protein [Verrucomicrobiae bacterium]MDD2709474.1 glycosyltransferase family 39 protein [Verrucomicrobiae bacterium]